MKHGTPGATQFLSDYTPTTTAKQYFLRLNKLLTGTLPKGVMKKALSSQRFYSSRKAPIVECLDLTARGGSKV